MVVLLLFGGMGVSEVYGQDSLQPIQFESKTFKRAFTLNTRVLSAAITAGKTSDKEKFDAILSWVVSNIRYDYRRYHSGKAFSSNRSLSQMLKRRKGICTDYTNLMDSLCIYAGLQNVTVTGYVKEVNFDVNDQVYFDNHAWNAVKLNGVWYLYDATWCSGSMVWDYKRFAKWRIKQIRKWSERVRKKELTFRSNVKHSERCHLPKETIYNSKTVDVIRFFPRTFITMLKWFPFKVNEKFNGVSNSTWYLANPEMFAVTHFPNNPIWAFTENTTNVTDFTANMKSYYTPEYLNMDKSRYGTFCLECDDYAAAGEIEQETKNYYASLQNNPNNHLLPGNYHLTMGRRLLEEALNEGDSLTKIQLMDSTETYLVQARTNYKKAQQDARIEAVFHFKKNYAKKQVLLKANRKDLGDMNKLVNLTVVKRNQIRGLAAKSRSLNRIESTFLNRFNNNRSDIGPTKKMKDEQIQRIRQKIAANNAYCDSLTTEIQQAQDRFKQNLGVLWRNLREQEEIALPLLNNYFADGEMRAFYLLDSYKFYIREIRTKIETGKEALAKSIDTNILDLSNRVCGDYARLLKMAKKREATFEKNKRNLMQLRRGGVMTEADVQRFCLESSETVTQTICWNSENESLVKSLVSTFNYFARVMRKSTAVIPWDSRMEQNRYQVIDRHVRRNKTRVEYAVAANLRLIYSMRARLSDHREKFERRKPI